METEHSSLARSGAFGDGPKMGTSLQYRLPMPLLNSTVLQGTPLRQSGDSHSNVSPTTLFRLPKLQESSVLKQFLKRKQIISRLIPRTESRKESASGEENEDKGERECEVAIMIRALKTLPDPLPYSFSPYYDPSQPRSKPLRLRKIRNSMAPTEVVDSVLSATPLLRRSAELLKTESKVALAGRKTESMTPVRVAPDRLEETKGDLLKGIRINMREQLRFRGQLNTSCPNVLPSDLVSKLPPKPKKYPKNIPDLKPTPDQLQSIYTQISSEFASAIYESNGVPPRCEAVYRCYIGPGNNSQLVAHLVKKRWFWTRVDDWEQADFVWTQNKQQSIVDTLDCARQLVSLRPGKPPKPFPSCKKVVRLMTDVERKKAGLGLVTESLFLTCMEPQAQTTPVRVYNRLERNFQLTSKKRLFHNLRTYCESKGMDVFTIVPVTFHVENGRKDTEFARFVASYQAFAAENAIIASDKPKSHNLWIIKPGEGTNCGHGIHVSSDLSEIKDFISDKYSNSGRKRTYIIQKYLERPLLVHKRKFDIRGYGLLTAFNGHIQGYFYHEGYLRTSSKEFSLKNSSRFVHLTNDAVQKKSEDYGKFESGNKMSYPEFQRYLEANYPGQVDFYRDLWPQIKALVTKSYEATYHSVDPRRRRHTFEVLGYDFMIDEEFKVWLIEVNTNPCLALSSAYLARLIPAMLENAFRYGVSRDRAGPSLPRTRRSQAPR